MTQAKAALIFGVATNSYVAWELGDYEPKIEKLIEIADYFDVSVDYLLGRPKKADLSPNEKETLTEAAKIIGRIFE